MVKVLYSLLFLVFSFCAFSQQADTVYLVNKRKLVVTIVEVNDKLVTYKETAFPDGRSYYIPRKDIYKIVRANGETKEYIIPVKEKIEREDKKKIEYKQSYLGLNLTPIIINSYGLSYEYIYKNRLGIRAYGQFSPSENRYVPGDDINFIPKTTLGGLEINSYLNGQSVVSIYGGIGFYTATFNSTLVYRAATQSSEALYFDTKSSFNAATINAGALVHLGRSVFIQGYGGAGFLKKNFSKQYETRWNFGIVLGIAF